MKFATDHHFLIGNLHVTDGKPCQDFTMAGTFDDEREGVYAIVSDGCSGGRHTDIGSRILTMATVRALMSKSLGWGNDGYPTNVMAISKALAHNAGETLGLHARDLLATQVWAAVDGGGRLITSVNGDGTIVLIDKAGYFHVRTYEWGNNRPYYAFEDQSLFLSFHGGADSADFKETSYRISPTGEVEYPIIYRDISTKLGMAGITTVHDVEAEGIEFVCLFTDGIGQMDQQTIDQGIVSLLGFKNLTGNFVKRRLIRHVHDSKKTNLGPLDDIGMAVIVIDHENYEDQDG